MSIMPGIENFAPERTDTSSGLLGGTERRAGRFLELLDVLVDLAIDGRRNLRLLLVVDVARPSVEIVNPGGTGSLALVISARPTLCRPGDPSSVPVAVGLAAAAEEVDVFFRFGSWLSPPTSPAPDGRRGGIEDNWVIW